MNIYNELFNLKLNISSLKRYNLKRIKLQETKEEIDYRFQQLLDLIDEIIYLDEEIEDE